jgi:tRNA (adenine22-N1)-methyltransferase
VHESHLAESSSRLAAVASLVPRGARVADIGTDAGLLPVLLLDTRRVSFCIASDRSTAGLVETGRRGARHVATGRLHVRQAVGLDAIHPEDEVNAVTIAGLGARTIRRILVLERLERLGVQHLVLQPQTEVRRVREWLYANAFGIVAERMVRDHGRDYIVIGATLARAAARRSRPSRTGPDLLEAGPCLVESADPLVRAHWERQLLRHSRILESAHGPAADLATERRELALSVLARLPRSV